MKKSTFENTYCAILIKNGKEVPFRIEWANGTGYFDGAVKDDLGLAPGELAASSATGEDKRRIIFVGTRFGNVVIFERYTPKEDGNENIVVVVNRPSKLSRFVKNGAMSTEHFEELTGCGIFSWNIGVDIERLFK